MGANAATKLYKLIKNVQRVLGIELLTAAQALDFRHPNKSSPVLEAVWSQLRSQVPFMKSDRVLHTDLIAAETFLDKDPRQFISGHI